MKIRDIIGSALLSIATNFPLASATTSAKPPLLLYNQFPRIWDMDFEGMTKYLPTIKQLGFNAVWVNPFMKTSKHTMVLRQHKGTGEQIKVIRSLYAMFDPSLIETETYTELSEGDPSFSGKEKGDKIRNYTETAKKLGLTPIFDLVLNHVSRDSPLVAGTFAYFIKRGIDTSEWFKREVAGKWDDVVPFDYDKEGNVEEIFTNLWKPFIEKMMKVYGFSGVRLDFATGPKVNPEIIRRCIEFIKSLNPKAEIFAEDLYPGSREDRERHVLTKSRSLGFTHVTNIAMYTPELGIGNKAVCEPILENLGLKKLMTHDTCDFRPGTIGFPGSHDAGPLLLMAKNAQDPDTDPVQVAKKRIAIAAFTSDAGWYLLAGDEDLSNTVQSPFVRQDGAKFSKTELELQKDTSIHGFISSINKTFEQLRSAPNFFWSEIFYSEDKKFLFFVRHLGSGEVKHDTDIVKVKICADAGVFPADEQVFDYLKSCNAELMNSVNLQFYEVG